MSHGDDIVFGEVAYREPVRMRRPDRDARKACVAYEVPAPGELPVFLERRPADAIERHSLRDTDVELGGILLGKECVDDETGEPFVLVTEALEAKHYENTQASFTYTHDSWEEITRERDEKHPDLDIVGWYHTHPDFGIFLSSHDLFIHHNFFNQPLQVAYVVDPIRQDRGFFQWRGGQMQRVRGFYLTSDRAERLALARLVNELEGLPSADGGGSGLSPRLEAELIAMLSRPHAPPPADRAQAAALFGLLGTIAGALLVGLLAWLYSLSGDLRRQAAAVNGLARAQSEATERLEKAVSASRVSARERALDAALASVGPGATAETLKSQYLGALQQAEQLRDRVSQVETEKVALAAHARGLDAQLAQATRARDQLRAELEEELDKVRGELQEARATLGTQTAKLDDDTSGGLEERYNLAFWAALGGWIAFALALVGFLVLLNRRAAEAADLEPPGPRTFIPSPASPPPQGGPRGGDPPPHVIE